jgi:hypothetical protein
MYGIFDWTVGNKLSRIPKVGVAGEVLSIALHLSPLLNVSQRSSSWNQIPRDNTRQQRSLTQSHLSLS